MFFHFIQAVSHWWFELIFRNRFRPKITWVLLIIESKNWFHFLTLTFWQTHDNPNHKESVPKLALFYDTFWDLSLYFKLYFRKTKYSNLQQYVLQFPFVYYQANCHSVLIFIIKNPNVYKRYRNMSKHDKKTVISSQNEL